MRACVILVVGLLLAADEPEFQPRRVAFAPDGKALAVAGWVGKGKRIDLIDLATRKHRWRQEVPKGVAAMAWTADGTRLLAAGGNEVLVLDAATGEQKGKIGPHAGVIWSMALSPDGKTVATGGENRSITLWNVADGKAAHDLAGHKGTVNSVAFSNDGKRLLTAGGQDVRLWDVASGKLVRVVYENSYSVSHAVFADGGRACIASDSSANLRVFETETGKALGKYSYLGGSFGLLYHDASETLVYASWQEVALATLPLKGPDKKTAAKIEDLLKALDDDSYTTREKATKDLIAVGPVAVGRLRRAEAEAPSAEVRIRARAIVAEVTTTPRANLRGHSDNLLGLALSPDGKTLATAAADHSVRLWDVPRGTLREVLVGK